MPFFHCTECHHEWEYYDDECLCDWCGADGYILEMETPFEKFCKMIESYQKLSRFVRKE